MSSVCAAPQTAILQKACQCQNEVKRFADALTAYSAANTAWKKNYADWVKKNQTGAQWQEDVEKCVAAVQPYQAECGDECRPGWTEVSREGCSWSRFQRSCSPNNEWQRQNCIQNMPTAPPTVAPPPPAPTPPSNFQIQCCSQVLLGVDMNVTNTDLTQHCTSGIQDILSGGASSGSVSSKSGVTGTITVGSVTFNQNWILWGVAFFLFLIAMYYLFKPTDDSDASQMTPYS